MKPLHRCKTDRKTVHYQNRRLPQVKSCKTPDSPSSLKIFINHSNAIAFMDIKNLG